MQLKEKGCFAVPNNNIMPHLIIPLSKREYGSSQYGCALKKDKLVIKATKLITVCIEFTVDGRGISICGGGGGLWCVEEGAGPDPWSRRREQIC